MFPQHGHPLSSQARHLLSVGAFHDPTTAKNYLPTTPLTNLPTTQRIFENITLHHNIINIKNYFAHHHPALTNLPTMQRIYENDLKILNNITSYHVMMLILSLQIEKIRNRRPTLGWPALFKNAQIMRIWTHVLFLYCLNSFSKQFILNILNVKHN